MNAEQRENKTSRPTQSSHLISPLSDPRFIREYLRLNDATVLESDVNLDEETINNAISRNHDSTDAGGIDPFRF